MLMLVTRMMPLNGSFLAEVNTADPNGIGPCLASSLKGPVRLVSWSLLKRLGEAEATME